MKRDDFISWNDYFMGLALLSSQRSKDPSTQVGACLVSPNNQIISVGYNGFPKGCSDDVFPWVKDQPNFVDNKYAYVVHAEQNCICNSRGDLSNTTMYVTLFPCADCAKMMIQSGVKRAVFLDEIKTPRFMESGVAARKMFDAAGVQYEQFVPSRDSIILLFKK